jgi:hypothetical protein
MLLMSIGALAADEMDAEDEVMAWPEFAAAKAVPMVAAPLPVETPSPRDVVDATEFFVKYPVRVSERAAMAMVFKTWKQLSKVPESHRDHKCFIQCRRVKLDQTHAVLNWQQESKDFISQSF